MSETIRLEIVTPESTVYSEDVDMVTLPGVEGEMGILPHHLRLVTQVVPGEMIVRKDGHDRFLAVGEGLVEVTGQRVSIVTNMAIAVENIDEAKAEEARKRAAARRLGRCLARPRRAPRTRGVRGHQDPLSRRLSLGTGPHHPA